MEESLLDLKYRMLKPSSRLQPRQPPGELFQAFQATGALRRPILVTPFRVGNWDDSLQKGPKITHKLYHNVRLWR